MDTRTPRRPRRTPFFDRPTQHGMEHPLDRLDRIRAEAPLRMGRF